MAPIPWSKIKLLIVDMDNTLCDTFHTLSKRQWEHVAREFDKIGREDISGALLKRFGRQSFASTLNEIGLTRGEKSFAIKKYDQNPVSSLKLFPDAKRILEVPHTKVLLSRGEPSLQRRKITHLGIRRYFKEIVIVDTFESKLQAIGGILKRHRLKPREALIIGDRVEEEIADGKRLGIPSILVHRLGWPVQKSRFKPDLVVRSLGTIASRLRQ